MNMKVENEMTLPTTKSVMVMLLEPYAGKLARTVLRGESSRKGADLLDNSYGCINPIILLWNKETQNFLASYSFLSKLLLSKSCY